MALLEIHHHQLSKVRQVRALAPMQRFVRQHEFLEYLRNVTDEVLHVRRMIDVARTRGLLEGAEVPDWRWPPPQEPADLSRFGMLALLVHVADQGGSLTVTADEIDRSLAAYGGLSRATLTVNLGAAEGRVDRVELRASQRAARPGEPED